MNGKFKLYQNKSSLRKRMSRYLQGGSSEIVGDKIAWWERKDIPKQPIDDIRIVLDMLYAGRPDLIAEDYYGTTELEWLVLQYNDIIDINEEFVYGKAITIPSNARVRNSITSTSST